MHLGQQIGSLYYFGSVYVQAKKWGVPGVSNNPADVNLRRPRLIRSRQRARDPAIRAFSQ